MIAIYTRHKLEKSALRLKNKLNEFEDIIVFSEENLSNRDVFNLDVLGSANTNIDTLEALNLTDIIARCRVLRSLSREFAVNLIERKLSQIIEFLERYKPKIVIIPRVDNFFLDLLRVVAKDRNIKIVGIWQSAFLKNHSFLTVDGDYNYFKAAELNTVNDLLYKLSSDNFKGTSVKKRFSKFSWFKKYLYLYARALLLETLQRLTKAYSYRNLATRFHVKEYRVQLVSMFREYLVPVQTVSKKLSGQTRPIFLIALQVNPESTIDYYCNDLKWLDIENVLSRLTREATRQGFLVVIKEHPNMDAFRPLYFYKHLEKVLAENNALFFDSRVSAREVMRHSEIVFSWTGTIAVEALLSGCWAMTVDHPYITSHPKHISLVDLDSLSDAFKHYNECQSEQRAVISSKENMALVQHIADSLFPEVIYYHNSNEKIHSKSEIIQFSKYIESLL